VFGATATTWISTGALGDSVRCRIAASNDDGVTYRTSNPVVLSASLAPVSVIAPTVNAAAGSGGGIYAGGKVTCARGLWSGMPTSYIYVWKIGSTVKKTSTSAAYTIPTNAGGKKIHCVVRATNVRGTGTKATALKTIAAYKVRVGTNSANVIRGAQGNDKILLRGGNDTGYGLSGNDWIIGGPGRDLLVGAGGNDRLDARDSASSRDTVRCGSGRDVAYVNRRDVVGRDCERVIRS
jgi:Ca2+-binding RTX toxin-like protein